MGWRELLAWLAAMKRQRDGPKPKEDSWEVEDPWFQEQVDRKYRERYGEVWR